MPEPGKETKLYLIPANLGDGASPGMLPAVIGSVLRKLSHFVVEDIRSARRFIKSVDRQMAIDKVSFLELNEHTREEELAVLLDPLKEGHDLGLISEAGLPCVADPGARLVRLAHEAGFRVMPLPGPSSVFLALMASGFNGQHFVFHGYLPVGKQPRIQKIREMESDMLRHDRTQIFMETPYRNNQLLDSILQVCRDSTRLCIAANLTLEHEMITVRTVGQWKSSLPDLNKQPAVFLIYR